MKKWLLTAALGSLASLAFAAAPTGADAKAMVEQQSALLLQRLAGNKALYQKNPDAFAELVREEVLPHMDFDVMARFVLGRHWNGATPAQRSAFTNAFRDLLVRVYSRGWTNYTGANVTVLGTPQVDEYQRTVIRAQVTANDGQKNTIVFNLRFKDGAWKIYDVSFQNVSILTSYRNTFDSDIQRNGLDALIAKVRTMKAEDVK
ncbi:MAG: ABC transporter substrate-binding protein [Cardiobacteriaceae bacterium]|nr:ABC transporter substrate-binding protein [Cardiobacteriaceae bacterium]